jgi:membrane fusion protein, multidrug efflux system
MPDVLFNRAVTANPSRRTKRLVPLLVGAGLLSAFLGCERGDKQKAQMPPRPPAPVTVAAAISRDVPVYLDQIGKMVSMRMVAIVPQVGGKLTAAHVEDGANVKKGDLLFEIDPRPYEAALASAQASLEQANAVHALAKTELARTENAVATDAVSRLQYDQKKNAVAIADARIAAAEADVQTAKLNLEYAKIYSPLDGRAGALLIHPGNIVKENNGPLLMIEQLDPIYAEFTVTENDLGTVRKAMASMGLDLTQSPGRELKVEVDIPGNSTRVLTALSEITPTTRPDASRAEVRVGSLTFLDNTVHTETGTIKLRATVPNSDHYFWPGQFVNCRLVLTTLKDAVLIPAPAQQIGQQGPFIYVVTPDNTAELRPIKPGQRQGDMIVVEQGVKPGEKVMVTGHMAVMPNGKVQIVPGAASVTQPAVPVSSTAPATKPQQ